MFDLKNDGFSYSVAYNYTKGKKQFKKYIADFKTESKAEQYIKDHQKDFKSELLIVKVKNYKMTI